MKARYLWGFLAILGLGASNAARAETSAEPLLLLGPVETIDQKESVVVVLGQRLPVRAVGQVEVGETLAVYGTINPNGTFNFSHLQRQGLYVPGATKIVLTGIVQKIAPLYGRATIAGVNVDLVSLAPLEQAPAIRVGSFVQLAGIQPVSGGLVLAQGIGGGATSGISGGARNGISGGARNGISGGARNGISGGATSGISGGARNGTSGGAKARTHDISFR